MKLYINILILFFVNTVVCTSQVLINEIYVLPEGVKTNQELFVEFYNPTKKMIDIRGYKLELYDSLGVLINSQVLETQSLKSTYVYPHGFKHVKINRENLNQYFMYAMFDINNAYLFKLVNTAGTVIDFAQVTRISNGKSISRYPDGNSSWGTSIATKNKRNNKHVGERIQMSIDFKEKEIVLDSIGNEVFVEEDLVGKLKINEVFYVISDDILNKDLWIELINVSNTEIELKDLMFSTDTLYGKQTFTGSENYTIKPKEVILIYLSNKYLGANSKHNLNLVKKSNVLKLYKGDILLDSVKVPVLDRNESYARIPNGVGEFVSVKYETPGQNNNQLMPGIYTKPSFVFLHSVGASLSNYTINDNRFDSKPRLGSSIGFSFQHRIGHFDLRQSLLYKRQGFRMSYDSTLYTSVGRLETSTKGYQRMEYFGYSCEIGLPVTRKLDLYYGVDFDIRLNNVSEIITTNTAILNTGEVLSKTEDITNDYAIKTDNIDLNLSIALEYKFSKYAYVNLSVRSDFGGANFNNIFNQNSSTQLVNSQIKGHWIKTNVLQLKLVVPFYNSEKLVPKSYLIGIK